ncbi:MAG: hypothetical protein JXR73_17300 [Candidatus Omnitrophica bacterium]|nr:hypothetical protein [Candidatus Omnitrophota bacterium]
MRAFLLLFTCFVVVGVVLFAMMQAPTPQKSDISVSRIDAVKRPLPVLQNEPATDAILDSFPLPTEQPAAPPSEENAAAAPTAVQPVNPASPQQSPNDRSNLNRLLALIDDWIYEDFSQIGSQKTGTIRKTREKELLGVFEGKELENGIKVVQLTDDSCKLSLGDESFTLRRVEEPAFFQEVKQQMRPLTVEEQEKAYEYYMRRYGDKFKAYSAMYEPPYGAQNPKRVTPEEKQRGLQEYFKRYGSQFQKEAKQNTTTFPYTEQQKENYIKYWQTFFPDRPMPAFEELFTDQNGQTAPGSRVQTEEQTQ